MQALPITLHHLTIHQIAYELMLRKQMIEYRQYFLGFFCIQVNKDALQNEHDRPPMRNKGKFLFQRVGAKIDRNPAQRVCTRKHRQSFILEGDDGRLVQLKPCAAGQSIGAAVKAGAYGDYPQIRPVQQHLPHKVIDDAMPDDDAVIANGLFLELIVNALSISRHEQFCIRIAADGMVPRGVLHPHAAAIERQI